MVRTLRCGRNNPGSNPGYGKCCDFFFFFFFFFNPPSSCRDRVVVIRHCVVATIPNPGHGMCCSLFYFVLTVLFVYNGLFIYFYSPFS